MTPKLIEAKCCFRAFFFYVVSNFCEILQNQVVNSLFRIHGREWIQNAIDQSVTFQQPFGLKDTK